MTKRFFSSSALSLLILSGCADDTANPSDTSAVADKPGSHVDELQSYLRQYGYLPSEELARDYPDHLPVVDEVPEPGVLDNATVTALRALQRRNGLAETALLDAETVELIHRPRCANTDADRRDHSGEKFARTSSTPRINNSTITWKILNSDDGIALSDATGAVRTALNIWGREMDVTFRQESSTTATDITFKFAQISTPSNALAGTSFSNPPVITFDTDQRWSFTGAVPSDGFDIATVALHEVGHALGLEHSSIMSPEPAIMRTSISPRSIQRSLAGDDRTAIRTLYDKLSQFDGLASDLAASPRTGVVWHIGTAANPGGFRIYKLFGGVWNEASGNGGAVRIAIGTNDCPVVIDSANNIWWHEADHNVGGWNAIAGKAWDIAVGKNSEPNNGNTVPHWIVSTTPDAGGGFRVAKATSNGWVFDAGPSNASRIAVGPDGRPWIVSANGVVMMRNSADPNVAGWTQVTGGQVTAQDISVDNETRPWITSFDNGIFVRNDQAAPTPGATGADGMVRAEWVRIAGTGTNLSVGWRTLWVADTAKRIWKQND
jgi:peptidoglycan hydrolase-like protein with peptidoglycan-binding domain